MKRIPSPSRTHHDSLRRRLIQCVQTQDGKTVFTVAKEITGGSKRTVEFARKHKKPCLHVSQATSRQPESEVTEFVKHHDVKLLNIAGSRESKEPGINEWVQQVLNRALFSAETLGGSEEL